MSKKQALPISDFLKELGKLNPIKAVIITIVTKGGCYEVEFTKGKKS